MYDNTSARWSPAKSSPSAPASLRSATPPRVCCATPARTRRHRFLSAPTVCARPSPPSTAKVESTDWSPPPHPTPPTLPTPQRSDGAARILPGPSQETTVCGASCNAPRQPKPSPASRRAASRSGPSTQVPARPTLQRPAAQRGRPGRRVCQQARSLTKEVLWWCWGGAVPFPRAGQATMLPVSDARRAGADRAAHAASLRFPIPPPRNGRAPIAWRKLRCAQLDGLDHPRFSGCRRGARLPEKEELH